MLADRRLKKTTFNSCENLHDDFRAITKGKDILCVKGLYCVGASAFLSNAHIMRRWFLILFLFLHLLS